ncbi:HepT-like ribonuclease domain-containing protein [Thioalkalivibrio sp. ALE28]
MDACAMRNVLTHLYDTIDLERVIGAVTPALQVYTQFAQWAEQRT